MSKFKFIRSILESKHLKKVVAGLEDDSTPSKPVDLESEKNVGVIAQHLGWEKSKSKMFAMGKNRDVTLLKKVEEIDGKKVSLEYVINPKTGSWGLRAALEGQDDSKLVEIRTGEDPISLGQDLKKEKKLVLSQLKEVETATAGDIAASGGVKEALTITRNLLSEEEIVFRNSISRELKHAIVFIWDAIGHDVKLANPNADDRLYLEKATDLDLLRSYGFNMESKELQVLVKKYGRARVMKLLGELVTLS